MALALQPGQHYPNLGCTIVAEPPDAKGRPGWSTFYQVVWDCCGGQQIISYEALLRRQRQGKSVCGACSRRQGRDFVPGPLPAASLTVLSVGPDRGWKLRPTYQVHYDCCGAVGWIGHWALAGRIRKGITQCLDCCPRTKTPAGDRFRAGPPGEDQAQKPAKTQAKDKAQTAIKAHAPAQTKAAAPTPAIEWQVRVTPPPGGWPRPAPDPQHPAAAWPRPASLAATPPAPWRDRAGWPPTVTAPRVTRPRVTPRHATPETAR